MKKIEASEGFVLCNGYAYGKEVMLPDNADESIWEEMTEEDAIELIRKNEEAEESEEPAGEDDPGVMEP